MTSLDEKRESTKNALQQREVFFRGFFFNVREKDSREKKTREKRVDPLYAYTCDASPDVRAWRCRAGKIAREKSATSPMVISSDSRIRGGQIDKRLIRISERRGHLTNEHTDTVPTIHPTIASLDSLIYVY